MTKVRILGPRTEAEPVLGELHTMGLVEVADARAVHGPVGLDGLDKLDSAGTRSRKEELNRLRVQAETLLAGLPRRREPIDAAARAVHLPVDLTAARTELERLSAAVESVDRRLDALRDERLVLSGHLDPLRLLLPLVPVLASLDVEKLGLLRLATVALVLNTDDEQLAETLRAQLADELGSRFELASTRVEAGAMGCLVVIPQDAQEVVRAMLGRVAVRSVSLPERFEGLSLHATVEAMQQRLHDITPEVNAAQDERHVLLQQRAEWLTHVRAGLVSELEVLTAVGSLVTTRRAFLAECWVPRPRLQELRRELATRLGSAVVVEDSTSSPYDPRAPVLLHNARLSRPVESLVGFLELPRAGSVDPTPLMAVFLPLMFGAMVGDVGYGIALFVLAILARRRFAGSMARLPEVRSLLWVLLLGAVWSIIFGVLYGEFFGDLGQRAFGNWALWQYRASAEALEPLLLFAVVLGAAHVVLGLVLGGLQAVRFRQARLLFDKLGTLLALAGLFGLAGLAADRLPPDALTPSVAVMIVGIVLATSLHGALGIVTGALDLLGSLGNILSYLRLAAVGLASAHLASVANELGSLGPIWMGILVATFFHALNLALASFSPMIQSLRLHYVEFFGAFFIGGGRPFRPFGREQGTKVPSTV